MSTPNHERPSYAQGGDGKTDAFRTVAAWLLRQCGEWREERARREKERQIAAELNQMSPAELAELGFFRCDIQRVARECAEKA